MGKLDDFIKVNPSLSECQLLSNEELSLLEGGACDSKCLRSCPTQCKPGCDQGAKNTVGGGTNTGSGTGNGSGTGKDSDTGTEPKAQSWTF